MSDKSKKQEKKYAKAQRNLRQRKQVDTENNSEKLESSKTIHKVISKPSTSETQPPESSENFKRVTDEVLNISEEANSKYKKKEIISNWSKYEVPMESYDEISEQQNLGADYATLVGAPQSASGHFQFKHEKFWDTPIQSQSDFYKINMVNLCKALSSIPFYERNNIKPTEFTAGDILNMDRRALKFKKEYFKNNNQLYNTPETVAQDKILDSLRESLKKHSIGDKCLQTNTVIETENPAAVVEEGTPTEKVSPTGVEQEKGPSTAATVEEVIPTAVALEEVCPATVIIEEETPSAVAIEEMRPTTIVQAEKLTIREDDDLEELEHFAFMLMAKNKALKSRKQKRFNIRPSTSNVEPAIPQVNIGIEGETESKVRTSDADTAQRQVQETGTGAEREDTVVPTSLSPIILERTASNESLEKWINEFVAS